MDVDELKKKVSHLESTLKQLTDRLAMQEVINEALEKQIHTHLYQSTLYMNPYNRDKKK